LQKTVLKTYKNGKRRQKYTNSNKQKLKKKEAGQDFKATKKSSKNIKSRNVCKLTLNKKY